MREHRKTAILAAIATVLVGILVMPLTTISVRVELPPAAGSAADKAPAPQPISAAMLAADVLIPLYLIVTVILVVWVIRRCVRHIADAKKPNPADVF